MNCKIVEQLMSDYIDGNLNQSMNNQFEEHIAECCKCKKDLEKMSSMVSSLSILSDPDIQIDCWSGVRNRITGKKPERRFEVFLKPIIAAPSFVVIILLAILIIWPKNIEESSVYNTATVPEYATYISAHSRLQRQQTMQDPDVTFITAELEKESLDVNQTDK